MIYTVYTFRNAAGEPLYIGCSGAGQNRVHQHRRKGWWPDVASATFEHFTTVSRAREREADLIRELAPQANVVKPSVGWSDHRTHWRPAGRVVCTNCGDDNTRYIRRGVRLSEANCPHCGVPALEQRDTVDTEAAA